MTQVIGNFASLTVGTGDAINTFNADGSYTIQGTGTFGIINAAQFKGREFMIGSSSGNNNLGILFGGIGSFSGLNIYPASTGIYGSTGNIVFKNGNSNQGIVFADNSFLNSANNFSNINSDKATFNSINVVGDIVGNYSKISVDTINCSNKVNSNIITGNTATINRINMNDGFFNNISGNNLTTSNIIFKDNTILNSAPASKILSADFNVSGNLTPNGPNAPIGNIPPGKWLLTFNIFFNSTTSTSNYITYRSSGNNITQARFALVTIPGTPTTYVCSGTCYFSPTVTSSIDLLVNVNAIIDKTKSYHQAINLG